MPRALLTVEDVSKTYDGFKAISNLNFYLQEGELRTVIGPNGAGKSTFFDLITGRAQPDQGKIEFGSDPATHRDLRAITGKLRELNPAARLWDSHDPDFSPSALLSGSRYDPATKPEDVLAWLAFEQSQPAEAVGHAMAWLRREGVVNMNSAQGRVERPVAVGSGG